MKNISSLILSNLAGFYYFIMSANWYSHFPDNYEVKDVYIQAAGKKDAPPSGDWMANLLQVNWNPDSRHALIYWSNGTFTTPPPAAEVREVRQESAEQSLGIAIVVEACQWKTLTVLSRV